MKFVRNPSCLKVEGDITSVEDIQTLVKEVHQLAEQYKEICYCCNHNITIPSAVICELEKEAKKGISIVVNAGTDKVMSLLELLDSSSQKLHFRFQKKAS